MKIFNVFLLFLSSLILLGCDDSISSSEGTKGLRVSIDPTIFINENNQNDLYTLAGTCSNHGLDIMIEVGPTPLRRKTVCTRGRWQVSDLNLASEDEGGIDVKVTHGDGVGEGVTATASITKDVTLLTEVKITFLLDYINRVGQGAFEIAGSCPEKGQVLVTVGETVQSGFCDGAIWSVVMNLSSEAENDLVVIIGFKDLAGNTAGVLIEESVVKDTIPPRPLITRAAGETGAVNAPFEMVITFSEEVNDFVQDDISVSGGTVGELASSDDGTTYTATITPLVAASVAEITINVEAEVSSDLAGNGNEAAPELVVAVDTSIL